MTFIRRFILLLHFGLIGLLGYLFIGLFSPSASAQTMSNDNYRLQLDAVNIIHPKSTVKNNTLGVTSERPAKKQSEQFFTFSISQTLIDFSTLSPTNPIKRSNKLTISSGSSNGYSVIAFEDKELSSSPTSNVALASSAFIPDTTCDNGLCSEAVSAAWTNPLTYGFG